MGCEWHACMQAMERRRLKRMRGGDDSDGGSDDDNAEAPAGGFAKRRFQAARAEADPGGKAAARCATLPVAMLLAPLACDRGRKMSCA